MLTTVVSTRHFPEVLTAPLFGRWSAGRCRRSGSAEQGLERAPQEGDHPAIFVAHFRAEHPMPNVQITPTSQASSIVRATRGVGLLCAVKNPLQLYRASVSSSSCRSASSRARCSSRLGNSALTALRNPSDDATSQLRRAGIPSNSPADCLIVFAHPVSFFRRRALGLSWACAAHVLYTPATPSSCERIPKIDAAGNSASMIHALDVAFQLCSCGFAVAAQRCILDSILDHRGHSRGTW